jgi:hypothetical protein
MRTTHTYALLEVSGSAYDEIKSKLVAAGYDSHVLTADSVGDQERVHLQGIAIVKADEPPVNKSLTTKIVPPKFAA